MAKSKSNSETLLPDLPTRARNAHKGDFGRVLIMGGSRGMTGAAVLAGTAALRSGAGLVQVAVPQECWPIVAAGEPAYMTVPLPADQEGRLSWECWGRVEQMAQQATVVACGPGLSQSAELVQLLIRMNSTLACPLVLDADALNGLVGQLSTFADAPAPRVLTPHPGEFRRLLGRPDATSDELRTAVASFAEQHRSTVILKGNQTLVTDGRRTYQNTTGNPGMATGGSGDVLTGVIAALIGQGLTPWDAACLGVHVHGLAGDLACQDWGEVSLIASDLPRYLGAAFCSL